MKTIRLLIILLSISVQCFSKDANILCENVIESEFKQGDGSRISPYLICNILQFRRLSQENDLLTRHFKFGSDLNLDNMNHIPIGSQALPFSGGVDGDGYSLSNVVLAKGESESHIGIFGMIRDASIVNVDLMNIQIPEFLASDTGALAGETQNSLLVNVHVDGLLEKGSDFSGGLVGRLINSIVINASVSGIIDNTLDTDGSGGLIGGSINSSIYQSSSDVRINNIGQGDFFAVTSIGGLVGWLNNSLVKNSYSINEIKYESVTIPPRNMGGLIGTTTNGSTIINAYTVSPSDLRGQLVGAAIGFDYTGDFKDMLYFNKDLTVANASQGGSAATTEEMVNPSFWIANGFDTSIWSLKQDQYPLLRHTCDDELLLVKSRWFMEHKSKS